MAIAKVIVKPHTNQKLSNMEHSIVHMASKKVKDGCDLTQLQDYLEKEIRNWKKRDRYKDIQITLEVRSEKEMTLMSGKNELVLFQMKM